jgi:hypothetical protein
MLYSLRRSPVPELPCGDYPPSQWLQQGFVTSSLAHDPGRRSLAGFTRIFLNGWTRGIKAKTLLQSSPVHAQKLARPPSLIPPSHAPTLSRSGRRRLRQWSSPHGFQRMPERRSRRRPNVDLPGGYVLRLISTVGLTVRWSTGTCLGHAPTSTIFAPGTCKPIAHGTPINNAGLCTIQPDVNDGVTDPYTEGVFVGACGALLCMAPISTCRCRMRGR